MATRRESIEIILPGHLRLRIVVGYDGTNYLGWQTQREGATIQQQLELALGKIFPCKPVTYSSSRTDAGVHAIGMVVHFDVPIAEWKMVPRKLILALNAHLPLDIRVSKAARVSPDFHARFDSVGTQYRYFVWNDSAHTPLWHKTHWHVPRPLDIQAMKAAAKTLVGRHDFIAFSSSPGYTREHTIRNVRRCEVRRSGNQITFLIEADGFLYKMCRGIAGTIVQVGEGRFTPDQVLPMIEQKARCFAGMTAPAHGLVLWKVFYRKRGQPRRPHPADVPGPDTD